MFAFYHLEKNLSFLLDGFEKTPTVVPDNLPWASLITKEFLNTILDDLADKKIILNSFTTFSIYQKITENKKKFFTDDTEITDEQRKEIIAILDEKLSKNNYEKSMFETNIKRYITSFIENVDLEKMLTINKLYFFSLKGPYVITMNDYMRVIEKSLGLVTIDVGYARFTAMKKWLKQYLDSYSWRMENFSSLQKFVFHTRDIQLGVSKDLRFIQDLICPKLYALVDSDSSLHNGVGVSMSSEEIVLTGFVTVGGQKITITETEKNPLFEYISQLNIVRTTEGDKKLHVTERWRSEAFVILPLLLEFFTIEYDEDGLTTSRESFIGLVLNLVKQHLVLSSEKISDAIDHYFAYSLIPELRDLFKKIIYIYLNPIDEEVRNDFKNDAERMMEVFNQYEQSL